MNLPFFLFLAAGVVSMPAPEELRIRHVVLDLSKQDKTRLARYVTVLEGNSYRVRESEQETARRRKK